MRNGCAFPSIRSGADGRIRTGELFRGAITSRVLSTAQPRRRCIYSGGIGSFASTSSTRVLGSGNGVSARRFIPGALPGRGLFRPPRRSPRPCPRFSARYVVVTEWQFGHSGAKFSTLLFFALPSICSISTGTLPVVGCRSAHPHLGHRSPNFQTRYLRIHFGWTPAGYCPDSINRTRRLKSYATLHSVEQKRPFVAVHFFPHPFSHSGRGFFGFIHAIVASRYANSVSHRDGP